MRSIDSPNAENHMVAADVLAVNNIIHTSVVHLPRAVSNIPRSGLECVHDLPITHHSSSDTSHHSER